MTILAYDEKGAAERIKRFVPTYAVYTLGELSAHCGIKLDDERYRNSMSSYLDAMQGNIICLTNVNPDDKEIIVSRWPIPLLTPFIGIWQMDRDAYIERLPTDAARGQYPRYIPKGIPILNDERDLKILFERIQIPEEETEADIAEEIFIKM